MATARGFIDRYKGSGKTGAFEWFFQRVSGIALLILLIGHFYIQHFYAPGTTPDYHTVAVRLSGMGWKLFDLTFVVFALWHGINGIFEFIDDYVHSDGWRLFIRALFWVLGIFYLILALLTILPFSLPQGGING